MLLLNQQGHAAGSRTVAGVFGVLSPGPTPHGHPATRGFAGFGGVDEWDRCSLGAGGFHAQQARDQGVVRIVLFIVYRWRFKRIARQRGDAILRQTEGDRRGIVDRPTERQQKGKTSWELPSHPSTIVIISMVNCNEAANSRIPESLFHWGPERCPAILDFLAVVR